MIYHLMLWKRLAFHGNYAFVQRFVEVIIRSCRDKLAVYVVQQIPRYSTPKLSSQTPQLGGV